MLHRVRPVVVVLLLLHAALAAVRCETTRQPGEGPQGEEPDGVSAGGLKSVLEDAVSPAFGATIIIIITVIVSGGAYLCFLKYVCAGCCSPQQVAPTADDQPIKVEEQV